jgi:hypothetical protein
MNECNCLYWRFLELMDKRNVHNPKPNGDIIVPIVNLVESSKKCDSYYKDFSNVRQSMQNDIGIERWSRIIDYSENEQDLVIAGNVLYEHHDWSTFIAKRGLSIPLRFAYNVINSVNKKMKT